MNKKRIGVLVLSLAAAVALYALLGFLLLPYVARTYLISFVEKDLGHRLTLGDVRFNPFTLRAEIADIDLREPDGKPMFACRRLAADLQTASLWRRAWTFADITADAPQLEFELRPGGRHNFSSLLDALRDPKPQPDQPPPSLAIGRIAIGEGRVQISDPQAGPAARLTLEPIAFELTELTTEASDGAPYKLSARSSEGERIEWRGEITLNPLASKGSLALQEWKVATAARWLGSRVALDRADGSLELSLSYDGAFAGDTPALMLTGLEARVAGLALASRGAPEPFIALERVQLSGGTLDLAARKFSLERLEIARPKLALQIAPGGKTSWSGIVPSESPQPQAAAASEPKASAEAAPSWTGRIARLAIADGALAFADRRAEEATEKAGTTQAATQLAFDGLRFETAIEAVLAPAQSAVTVSGVRAAVAHLALRSGAQTVEAAQAAVEAGSVAATLASATQLALRDVALTLAAVALKPGNDELRLGKMAAGASGIRVELGPQTSLSADADGLSLEAGEITAARTGTGSGKPMLEIEAASARAPKLALEGADAAGVRVEGATAAIRSLRVRDPGSGNELARLGSLELAGATASVAQRTAAAEKLTLSDLHASAILTRDGKTNWEPLLAAFARGDATQPPAQAQAAQAPWKASVRALEVRNAGAAITDQRQDPPLAAEVQQVRLVARGMSTEARRPMRLELSGRIKDGGQFSAAGRLDARTLATDLKVKLAGLPLVALQPYVARYARVQIVSALASADGRVRYGMPKAAGAQLEFEGDVSLEKVIVEETEPAQPLLSVDVVRASQARFTLSPNGLEIPDLRINRLATRLIITQDQSMNIAKLLRSQAPPGDGPKPRPGSAGTAKPQPQAGAASKPPAADAAKPPAEDTAQERDDFPIAISRVRLDDSVLEFSDLSLRPQFNTRMHELQGVITGIATSVRTRARVELDARVDEFGSAQIRGSMNLFRPRAFTDVTMIFRNLEMTDLTPYAEKFAGYRIASGKLSVDLRYRVKNSALVGENKFVIDKLELGERVESPTALDLPLELAIAILADENGRIDIGVPVTGSLEDPQFSIAAVVWKAIGNLLGRIVTAPFRALASIFGGGASADELASIEFDPGSARLAPPERMKLQTVAEALAKRPELRLTVRPAYAPQADRDAIRSEAVRRAVVTRAGIKLEPGESPGPLDYGNARIRRAIEDTFTDQFGFPAARDLRAEAAKRKPPAGGPAAEAPQPPASEGKPAPGDPPAADAQGGKPATTAPASGEIRTARAMVQRLIEARTVEDSALAQLAQQRGQRVVEVLRDAAKVDPGRITTAEPRAVEGEGERTVATALELGVVK